MKITCSAPDHISRFEELMKQCHSLKEMPLNLSYDDVTAIMDLSRITIPRTEWSNGASPVDTIQKENQNSS